MILFIRHIFLKIVTRTAKKIWDWLSSSNPRDTHPSRTFMTVTLFRRVAWNTNRRKKYLPAAVQDWRKDLLRKLRRIFDTTIEDTQFTFCWYGLRFDIFAYLVFHGFLAYIYFRLPACTKRLPPQLMPEANLLWLVAYLCHLVNFLVVYWNTLSIRRHSTMSVA